MKIKTPIILGICTTVLFISFKSCPVPVEFFLPAPKCVHTHAHPLLTEPGTLIYQEAATRILSQHEPEDFRYFFETFTIEEGNYYVVVNLRNSEYCVQVPMRVTKWGNLFPMLEQNGASYPEELLRVKWEIVEKAGKKEVHFLGMYKIID
ncbi:MAG: hypothetical protein AAFR59_03285 [Bacteroidota bacterium]